MLTRVENQVDFCAGSSTLFNLTTWHHHACILYWQGTKAPGWQTTWEFFVSWCCLSTFYIHHQQYSASCIGWSFLVFFFKQISGHNIPKSHFVSQEGSSAHEWKYKGDVWCIHVNCTGIIAENLSLSQNYSVEERDVLTPRMLFWMLRLCFEIEELPVDANPAVHACSSIIASGAM